METRNEADTRLLPALRRLWYGELDGIVRDTEGALLLEPYLQAPARVLENTARVQMAPYRALGAAIRDLGGSFSGGWRMQGESYTLNRDADSHAVVVARRILSRAAEEKTRVAAEYRRLAERAQGEALAALLGTLAEGSEALAATYREEEERLAAAP